MCWIVGLVVLSSESGVKWSKESKDVFDPMAKVDTDQAMPTKQQTEIFKAVGKLIVRY